MKLYSYYTIFLLFFVNNKFEKIKQHKLEANVSGCKCPYFLDI